MSGKRMPWIMMGVKGGLAMAVIWTVTMGFWTGEWRQALTIGPFVGLLFGIFFPLTMRLFGARVPDPKDSQDHDRDRES